MTGGWDLVAAAMVAAFGIGRHLISLWRCRSWYETVERLVSEADPGFRIVWREADGALVKVTLAGQNDEPDRTRPACQDRGEV